MESEYIRKLKMREPVRICIDLDGTILEFNAEIYHPFTFGDLRPGAKETMERLRKEGYYIVVHTARPLEAKPYIERCLTLLEVPFDDVVCGKPFGVLYFDDRTICGASWELFNLWLDSQNKDDNNDTIAERKERYMNYYSKKMQKEGGL